MIRKIFKTGHSLAVTIQKKQLLEAGLKLGDKVSIELGGNGKIVLNKARGDSQLDLGLKIRHHLGEARKGS